MINEWWFPRRRPADFMANAYDDLCASRLMAERQDVPTMDIPKPPCPVCGEPCDGAGCEGIETKTDGEWKTYRPGRLFYRHENKTCIDEWERGLPQEGDVCPKIGG